MLTSSSTICRRVMPMGDQIFAEGVAPGGIWQKNIFIQRFRKPQDIVKAVHAVGIQHALKQIAGVPVHRLHLLGEGTELVQLAGFFDVHIFEITAKIVDVADDLRDLGGGCVRTDGVQLRKRLANLSRGRGQLQVDALIIGGAGQVQCDHPMW